MKQIKVIAFDADDTLWVNEPYFREAEDKFCALLEEFLPRHQVAQELFKVEMQNLELYGYGVKAFMLSMMETALRICEKHLAPEVLERIIEIGREQLDKPVVLLEGVQDVLESLKGRYRLVVATKGDLLDQERKLQRSGLAHYFHHIEIMSDKKIKDYQKLIKHLDCQPEEFLMVGNSLKSDILPVLEIGGHAVHIPYHITWQHETVETEVEHANFRKMGQIVELPPVFA